MFNCPPGGSLDQFTKGVAISRPVTHNRYMTTAKPKAPALHASKGKNHTTTSAGKPTGTGVTVNAVTLRNLAGKKKRSKPRSQTRKPADAPPAPKFKKGQKQKGK